VTKHDSYGAPAGANGEHPFADQALVFRQTAEERNRGSAGLGGWLTAFANLFLGSRERNPADTER
jgi:hypothetical protein